MQAPIDDATEQFLIAAAEDLQHRLGASAEVDRVAIETAGGEVVIVATLRAGHRAYEVRGVGKDVVAAYADVRTPSADILLRSAYSELIEATLPPR